MSDLNESDIKDLIDARYDGLEHSYDFIKEKVIGVLNATATLGLSEQEKCILGTYSRIQSLVESVLKLKHINDYDSISILARTVFELEVDVCLLSTSDATQDDFERFTSFPEVDNYKKALRIHSLDKENPELIKISMIGIEKRNEFIQKRNRDVDLEDNVVRLWGLKRDGSTHWPKHWTGKTFFQRVGILGLEAVYQYREIYAFLSNYVHSGSSAYSGFDRESFIAVYGTSIEFLRLKYLESTKIVCRCFSLDKAVEDYFKGINYLDSAPDTILKKYYLSLMDN